MRKPAPVILCGVISFLHIGSMPLPGNRRPPISRLAGRQHRGSQVHPGWLAFLALCLLSPLRAPADTFNVVLQGPNGKHIPEVLGASGSIDSIKAFTGFDYFEWYGITHHRYWFKPSFSPLNPTGGVTNTNGFNAATAAIRADPWRQGTDSDVYFDWARFNSNFDVDYRYTLQRYRELGITPMMVNTTFTDQDPLADWGNKFMYWKYWYAYVYFFASQYNVTMYEFSNEPNSGRTYSQWQSHWLVCADAMRKAMADVNADYGKNLTLYICGPTMPGPYWDYSLPDPEVDFHGWGSVSWADIHTDIFDKQNTANWNYGMYDYHRYRNDGQLNEDEIATLRTAIATSHNANNATIPLLISEYMTSTAATFDSKLLDSEDMDFGIGVAQIMQATATLGSAGLGDKGGFFFFKLGTRDSVSPTVRNCSSYMSSLGDYNYGGITRGGACFQMYARHFRGGKPLLGLSVTAGAHDKRRAVAVLDEAKRAYYLYFSNQNGTSASAVIDVSALDVLPGVHATLQRVDANNTGQITDYLTVSAGLTLSFTAPDNSAFLLWIPKGNSAENITSKPAVKDTYLVVSEGIVNHGDEETMKVSIHHSAASGRRLAFLQFDLLAPGSGNRYLLKLTGHNIGDDQTSREILHLYGRPGGTWSDAGMTLATAPGVGKYYTSTNAMSATTGLATDMSDIEDNYAGVAKGTGLGIYGKFLGPLSFFSNTWKNNYIDVTDYVQSLIAAGESSVTFILARPVRYDVNQFSNANDYSLGVYDCDGRIVEIAANENATGGYRPLLYVYRSITNDPPTLSRVGTKVIHEDEDAGPIAFTVTPSKIVTPNTSNPTLVPASNIVIGITTDPWSNTDLGAVAATGSGESFPGDKFSLVASGADLWNTADEGHFMYQPMTGDGELIARVATLQNTYSWAKAGVMMRVSTNANSVNCCMAASASQGVTFQRRLATGGATTSDGITGITVPCWIRLVRTGTNFAGYYAADSEERPDTWIQVGPAIGMNVGTNMFRGLAGSSHADGTRSTMTFDHVSGPANRTVTITPATNQYGTATIRLSTSDGAFTTNSDFVLTVSSVNDAPAISNTTNRSIVEDAVLGPLSLTVDDVETTAGSLSLTRVSSNTTLVPTNNIVFGGSGSNRTVTITPATNTYGTATITLTVSDGELTASDSFILTVTSVNDAPTISNTTNQTINEDAILGPLAFTVDDAETTAGSLSLTKVSSNTTLVPTNNIVFGGSGSNRTVTVTPAANRYGTATITITVSDGTLTASDSFILTVNSVNDAPVLAAVQDRAIGTGRTMTITNIASDVDLPAQALTFGLLTAPSGALLGSSNGILTWRPAVAQAGSTNPFSVMVGDNGTPVMSTTQKFTVVVNPYLKPTVSTAAVATNGHFQCIITGDSGPDYNVWASTNLADWSPLFTTNSPTLPFAWSDPDAGNFIMRFYRVLLSP